MWFQLLFTNDRQVKCKHDESMTKQSIFVKYYSSLEEAFEFCWSSLADEHNKFVFGTKGLYQIFNM